MSFQSAGTSISPNYYFNTGQIDVQVGGQASRRLASVVSIKNKWKKESVDARAMNTHLAIAKRVTKFEYDTTFEVNTVNWALMQEFFLGSGQSGTLDSPGYDFSVYDGQPIQLPTLNITGYQVDPTSNPIQLQYIGALIKSIDWDMSMGKDHNIKMEVSAIQVVAVMQMYNNN